MSSLAAIGLFLGCLVLGALASAVLSHRLDQVGTHLRLSEGLLGLLTALGADSPEIASAVTALVSGQHELGSSVILGSNIFNLASLLGLGAVAAGGVTCGRNTLVLNAGVALWVTGVVALQLLYALPPGVAGPLIAAVMVPYVLVSALRPSHMRWLRVPAPLASWLWEAVTGADVDTGEDRFPPPPSWADTASLLPLLGMVVITSVGMVRTASLLGTRWGVPEIVLGALVLATLTGVPNVIAALRLAVQGRGSAVVSETFNSNSLNLIAGAFLPTLFVAAGPPSATARLTLWWLCGLTVLATLLFLPRDRLGRPGGWLLIAAYAGFAATLALW